MKDEHCPTCNNPIGASLKALREERDRLMPFVIQHRPKRDEFLKWEKDIKDRAAQVATSEAALDLRREKFARDEGALEELLKEARRPEEEFEKLRQENQGLHGLLESAAEDRHKVTEESKEAMESLRQKINSEKKKRRAADLEATSALSELSTLTESHHDLNREFGRIKTLHTRVSGLLESARNEIASLKREKLDLSTQKSAIERKAASLQATNEKLASENQQLSKRVSDLRSTSTTTKTNNASVRSPFIFDLDLLHSFSQEVSELFMPAAEIVSLGSGPFSEYDFDRYLKSLGITPYADGCPWIIVGREGWTEEELNALIDNADLEEVRVFSQELFVAGILTTHNPFSLSIDVLMKFAEGHPALEYLIHSGFEWPETVFEEDYGEPLHLGGSYVKESPICRMGYHVGSTKNLSPRKRRQILQSAYQEAFWKVEDLDADYMAEWGYPRRSKRLWRIAHHIRWLIRSRKTTPSMRKAVKDWKDDLNWLKEEFYTNRMRFKWPLG